MTDFPAELKLKHFLFIIYYLTRSVIMARKALIVKANRKPKYSTRVIRRCQICGRSKGFMRAFNVCRICFREMARDGQLPGIKKSSW